jgi:hypothetical protein
MMGTVENKAARTEIAAIKVAAPERTPRIADPAIQERRCHPTVAEAGAS